jgi:isopentenyl phosphate kinase
MLIFLKLGGSLITDKAVPESPRLEVMKRIAGEIVDARRANPELQILVGHGSGSYGHVAAAKHGTRKGVSTPDNWIGFSEVAASAARLNSLVLDILSNSGLPVLRFQPSASARCASGAILSMETDPIKTALARGLVPLVYGDVAFDDSIGGTIISTEDIFAYLATVLHPDRILLAGHYPGVMDNDKKVIRQITPATLTDFQDAIQGSTWADVTGGMETKVKSMLDLCEQVSGLNVHIFSGIEDGNIRRALVDGGSATGTLLSAIES